MKWFRFYDEFLDDTKVAMMSDTDQLLWVKALCLANSDKQRGHIKLSDEEICWKLRILIEQWRSAIDKFRAKGMIEHCEGGYKITNWTDRQFCSDSSTERVATHREKKKQGCNVTLNVAATPPDPDPDPDPDPENRSRKQIQRKESDRAQNDGEIEKAGKGIDDLSEKDFLALVLDAYNEFKPALWVNHHSMNLQRVKAVKNAMKETPDRDSFLRLVRDSLSHVKNDPDPWWSSKRKTFITLFEKGRIFDWADLWQDAQNNPAKFEVAARFQDPKHSKEIMAAVSRRRSYEQARLEIEQEQMNKQNPVIEVSHVEF
jgi:hypothetical protein